MYKSAIVLCLILFSNGCTLGLNRRLESALQNANIDFLSVEGNRKPSVPPASNPNQQNVDIKVTPTSTSTSTVASASKITTPISTVKQLINNFNDKGKTPSPASNKPSTVGMNMNSQRDLFFGPAIPTKSQPGAGVPTIGNQRPSPWSPVGHPGSTPAVTTRPGSTPIGNQRPLPSSPFGQPGDPSKDPFPGLSKPSGTSVTPSGIPTKPISWSSVVSGNSKPGGTPPSSMSPGNVPKTAQNLKPIVIGERDPPAGFPPITGGQSTTATTKELVSDGELKEVSEALLRKDTNNAAKHITVNYQGKTSSFSKDDLAPQPLLTVQPAVWNIPTIAAMKVLLDNYEQDTTVNEYITPQEKNEENEFMDLIMATPVIRHLMLFLKDKGVVTADPRQQRDVLKQIWFNMYSRGQGKIGSSGFEHIFVSEIKNGEISGLHNWIYFQNEESANRANYLGYLKKVELADKGAILKLHFNMKGIDKPVDTMFVGTSPELEIALYSLCFLTRVDRACPLTLAGQNLNLRTHNFRYRSKNMIGSAFPEI